jgi:hypothetical protein
MDPFAPSLNQRDAETYLLRLIDGLACLADDDGLADRNVRLTISLFYSRRRISASQHQALLLRMMRHQAQRTAAAAHGPPR